MIFGRVFKWRHWIGMVFLVTSVLPIVHKSDNVWYLTICFALFCLGVTLMCDYIANKLGGVSILSSILRTNKNKYNYFLIGLIGGLILEAYVSYFGGLWYYPFYNSRNYLIIAVVCGGFGAYFFSIITSYYCFKILFDKINKGQKKVTNTKKQFNKFFNFLGIAGALGISFTVYEIIIKTNYFRDFIFNINSWKHPYIDFYVVVVAFFSLWFIFEFVEFKRKRTSILLDLFEGYYVPLLAIILSSLLLALYMEVQNVYIGLWLYTNLPLESVKIIGLPIWMYVGWPLHYIGFISLYRAFGNGPSSELLAGDKIK